MASAVLIAVAAILAVAAPAALAQSVAPAPSPAAPLNITAILVKGGQYNSFIRLLQDTRVDTQINSQLNNSYNGLTIFAPTDNAFQNLKPGTLNGLSTQDQVQLVLFHVLPKYYSLATFQTASNPINTQAAGSQGVYTLNVTTSPNQANVSTGVDETQIDNALYSTFPLAVYSVDKVLLPSALFGAKPPAAAPTPSAVKPGGKSPGTAGAAAPATDADGNSSGAAGLKGGWSLAVGAGVAAVLGSLL